MNRIEIKEKAKKITKENFKGFWIGFLIVFGISFLCNFVISILFNEESFVYRILTLAVSFFLATLSIGLIYYILKMVRGEEYSKEDLFKFVNKILPVFVISFLVSLIVSLWSILLIIPGIIAALGYSMVFYIYADNQDLKPMEYLRKSKEMMLGYKWDYFVFGLSFLGWILLSVITFGIALIYVVPYMTIATTIYYDELKKLKEKK